MLLTSEVRIQQYILVKSGLVKEEEKSFWTSFLTFTEKAAAVEEIGGRRGGMPQQLETRHS